MVRVLLLVAAALLPAAASSAVGEQITFLARDLYFSPGNSSGVCAVSPAGGAPRLLREGRYDGLAWSADGRRLAFRRGRFLLVGDRYVAAGSPDWFAWSPDGRLLAYSASFVGRNLAGLWIVRPDGTGRRRLVDPTRATVTSATWAPDGRRIYFVRWAHPRAQLASVDVATTEIRTEDEVPNVSGASLSPDLSKLAFVEGHGIVRVARRDGSHARTLHPAAGTPPLVWASDSRRLAFSARGDLYVGDASTGKARRLTATPRIDEVAPAWRPATTTTRPKPCVAPPPKPPWR